MTYDYDVLFEGIVEAVRSERPVADAMCGLITECEAQRPHPDWSRFRGLDWEADLGRIERWIQSALADVPSELSAQGLWFGLNNPVVDGRDSADLYVAAAAEFEEGEIKWTEGKMHFSDHRELRSTVLDAVYTLAYAGGDGLDNDAEHPLALAYGGWVALRASKMIKLVSPLRRLRGAVVGFDSGDILFLGQFRDGAFIPDVVAG